MSLAYEEFMSEDDDQEKVTVEVQEAEGLLAHLVQVAYVSKGRLCLGKGLDSDSDEHSGTSFSECAETLVRPKHHYQKVS